MPTCVVQVFYHSKFTLEFFCGINYVIIFLVIFMFERINMLVNEECMNKFTHSHVLIVGVGGVGGACFEALVRMGIKYISIVDNDAFSESNLNIS